MDIKKRVEISREWAEADEVSDAVIGMMNERLRLDVDATQILVGVLLGLLGFMQTLPKDRRIWPESLKALEGSANQVVGELMTLREMGGLRKRGTDQ